MGSNIVVRSLTSRQSSLNRLGYLRVRYSRPTCNIDISPIRPLRHLEKADWVYICGYIFVKSRVIPVSGDLCNRQVWLGIPSDSEYSHFTGEVFYALYNQVSAFWGWSSSYNSFSCLSKENQHCILYRNYLVVSFDTALKNQLTCVEGTWTCQTKVGLYSNEGLTILC